MYQPDKLDVTRPARPALFSLPHLIAWLEGKEPSEQYDWSSCLSCLWARYAREHCGATIHLYETPFTMAKHELAAAHGLLGMHAMMSLAQTPPHTFGAALARARELQAGKALNDALDYECRRTWSTMFMRRGHPISAVMAW